MVDAVIFERSCFAGECIISLIMTTIQVLVCVVWGLGFEVGVEDSILDVPNASLPPFFVAHCHAACRSFGCCPNRQRARRRSWT